MDAEITWLLELRLERRGDRAAVAIIDRCLLTLTILDAANDEGRETLAAQVAAVTGDAARRLTGCERALRCSSRKRAEAATWVD